MKMLNIKFGNLDDKVKEHPERRGWVIGHFVDGDSPFKTNNFEVKYMQWRKGSKKDIPTASMDVETLCILLNGGPFMTYFPADGKKVEMSKVGDYVYFGSGIYHHAEALEDSTVLTMRWPSIQHNQVILYPQSPPRDE